MASAATEQFVRLLTRHERKLYGYILSLVPNGADADEILQETNIRLWQQFDKFEPGTDFGAWACMIAYYQVLTYRKRKGRNRLAHSQAFLDAVAEEALAAQSEADSRVAALERCTRKLPAASRELLDLCYQRGLSIRQAAETLGRSAEGVYKALGRIRLALHRCIDQSLQHDELKYATPHS